MLIPPGDSTKTYGIKYLIPLRKLSGIDIQPGNTPHFGFLKAEIKNIQVFCHMSFLRCTGDCNNASLIMPSQGYLCIAFIVFFAD
jgi:hypothetical protein